MVQKVTHTFFSAPILKHQTYFLQELTQNERIQLDPVDLGNLCHFVPIYLTPHHLAVPYLSHPSKLSHQLKGL